MKISGCSTQKVWDIVKLDGEFGVYAYNGWTYQRTGKRTFKTRWGACKRAARCSSIFHLVVVVDEVKEMEKDAKFRKS